VCPQDGERVAPLGYYIGAVARQAGFLAVIDSGLPNPIWSPYFEQSLYRELPPIALPALDTPLSGEVQLTCIPGTIRLPATETAKAMDVPEESWQGWQWPSGDQLLLLINRDIHQYTTGFMHSTGTTAELIYVAGAPMVAWRSSHEVRERATIVYQAEINGFFDAKTAFWAQVASTDAGRRDLLIASVATIRLASDS